MNNTFIYLLLGITMVLSACGGGSGSGSTGEAVQSRQMLQHDGVSREYILYIPATYNGSAEVPLLLNLHGFTSSATAQLASADMRTLAEANNFILVYPQGAGSIASWNAARSTIGADDIGFIETLISKLSLEYKVDDERVYAMGHSNGAMMSYTLACHTNGLIAAVGSVSGTQLNTTNCTPSHPTAIVSIHGTSDPLIPYNGNAIYNSVDTVLSFWRSFNNTSTTPVYNTVTNAGTPIERFQYTGGTNGVTVEHYKVVGGGHSWPTLNYQGADTGELLWNFVSQYTTDGLR